MEKLKYMKESLISCAMGQMGNLAEADTKEMGEVIDMIKDLEEAIYYCTITKSMENKEYEKESRYYPYHPYEPIMYYPIPMYPEDYRDIDYNRGKMYYMEPNGNGTNNGNGTRSYPYEKEYPIMMRDRREGKSPISRKNYMEMKETHQDRNASMKELERYVQELGQDLTEMVKDASPEEKQVLSSKISTLASKIQ